MTKSRKTKIIILSVLLFIIASSTIILAICIAREFQPVMEEIKAISKETDLPTNYIWGRRLFFYMIIVLGIVSVTTIVLYAILLKNKRITQNEHRFIRINRRIYEYGAVAFVFSSLDTINLIVGFLLIIASVTMKLISSQLSFADNERDQENT